jgi:hypothetical protein
MSPLQPWGFEGVYGYAAGTATGTVDVPTDARLRRVSVVAGTASAATVTIGGGNTITVPAGYAFDDEIVGEATNKDVVIAGGPLQAYYIAWVS